MAGFTTIGPGWYIEDMGDTKYATVMLTSSNARKIFGVASEDSFEELLEASAVGEAKRLDDAKTTERVVLFQAFRVQPGSKNILTVLWITARLALDEHGWVVRGYKTSKERP